VIASDTKLMDNVFATQQHHLLRLKSQHLMALNLDVFPLFQGKSMESAATQPQWVEPELEHIHVDALLLTIQTQSQ
jgi:hypothetical protein